MRISKKIGEKPKIELTNREHLILAHARDLCHSIRGNSEGELSDESLRAEISLGVIATYLNGMKIEVSKEESPRSMDYPEADFMKPLENASN